MPPTPTSAKPRSLRRLVLACSVALPLAFAAPAQAEGPPAAEPNRGQMAAAKKFFDRGQALYKEGKYDAAWVEFSSAYEIAPLPDLVYNLARCEEQMGRKRDAIQHYNEFLRLSPNDRDADNIRNTVTRLELEATGATARIKPKGVQSQPTAAPPKSPSKLPVLYSLVTGGAAVAFLVIGGASLGVASSRYGSLSGSCAPSCTDEQVATVRTPANVGYAFLTLGALAGVATAVLVPLELRWHKQKQSQLTTALSFTGSSVALTGRF